MEKKLIHLHSHGWLDEFQQMILEFSTTYPHANVYALIDCAFSERCYATLQQQKHALQWRSLFDLSGNADKNLAAVSPTLLHLHSNAAISWRAVLRHTDGMPMLSVIVTSETLEVLTQRLQAWCVVDADGEDYCFRFADTRRLPDIVTTLTPQQHGQLFGPAQTWIYRDRFAQWVSLPLPTLQQPPAEEVRLNSSQCTYLISASEADEILADLGIYEPTLIQAVPPGEAYAAISSALVRANQGGIQQQDLYHWCTLWLRHPEIDSLSKLPIWLDEHRRGIRSYDDLTAGLTPHAGTV